MAPDSSEQRGLAPDVLAHIGLVEADHGHGVGVPALCRRPRGHAEAEGEVAHGVDDAALVLLRPLRDPAQAGLAGVVAVEELLLRGGLEPDLVLGVRREEVEGGDVETELLRLGELAEAGAEGDEVLPRAVRGLKKRLIIE